MDNAMENAGDKECEAQIDESYTTKKSAAQGLMDLSLLMANGTMLSSLLQKDLTGLNPTRVDLLVLSIILQTIAGVVITILSFRRMQTTEQIHTAEILNNSVVILCAFIVVVNVVLGVITPFS